MPNGRFTAVQVPKEEGFSRWSTWFRNEPFLRLDASGVGTGYWVLLEFSPGPGFLRLTERKGDFPCPWDLRGCRLVYLWYTLRGPNYLR